MPDDILCSAMTAISLRTRAISSKYSLTARNENAFGSSVQCPAKTDQTGSMGMLI